MDETVGRLCQVDDEEALTSALIELCSDDPLYRTLADNALERSGENRFSADHVYHAYQDLYARALAE